LDMPMTVSVGVVAGLVGEVAAGLKSAHGLLTAVPPGKKDRGAKVAARQHAYLGFLAATGDVLTWTTQLAVIAQATQRWEPFAWRHTTTALHFAADARKSWSAFLTALAEFRLVGNPEPRALAEQMTVILGQLNDSMPIARDPAEQKRQIMQSSQWQRLLGEAQKDFILAARRDLGTARKLRTHWWQLRRSRTEEDWPGGWPGPTATLPGERQGQA
jgi:hypothetical protein